MPVRTTSRWPCRTRFSPAASTAAAALLLDAPRTSGITQKVQEKLQPSWTRTNARTRPSRQSACPQPVRPRPPPPADGPGAPSPEPRRPLGRPTHDRNVVGQRPKCDAPEVGSATRDVYPPVG